jgi:hypothetical protein
MKKVLLSTFAAAFLFGVGAATFMPHPALAAEKPKVDCTKPENKDKPECKKK